MRARGRSRRVRASVVALVALVGALVGGAAPASAAGTRTISFTLERTDGTAITNGGVAACPEADPFCLNGAQPLLGFFPAGTIDLPDDQAWNLVGFTNSGLGLETSEGDGTLVQPGDGVTNVDFQIAAHVHSTVSWPGADPSAIIGIGACPAPETGTACPSQRVSFADGGAHHLKLTPGTWNLAAFHQVGSVVKIAGAGQITIGTTSVTKNLLVRHVDVRDSFGARIFQTPSAAYACEPALCNAPPILSLDDDDDGRVHIALDPTKGYVMGGVGWPSQHPTGGSVSTNPGTFVPANGPTTITAVIPTGQVQGVVTRTGFATLPNATTGVGACPVTDPYPCDNVKFGFANAAGQYRFVLPPGQWVVGSFTLVGGAVVVGTQGHPVTVTVGSTHDINPSTDAAPQSEGTADGNGDGIADSTQDNVTTFPINATETVTMVAPAGVATSSFAAVPAAELPPPPAGYTAPIGVLAFTLTNVPVGGTVDVGFIVPAGFPYAEYWKMIGSTWTLFPSSTVGGVTTITLTDGGAGDQDGTANGVIVDPGALLVPPTPPPAFGGFEAPVTSRGTVKAGSALPIQFTATAADGSALPAGDVGVDVRPCGGTATALAGLTTDGAGRWKVVWKTAKGATGCHVVTVHVAGGPSYEASVHLR